MLPLVSEMLSSLVESEDMKIYQIVSPEAAQGWKLELFEITANIKPHYHVIQRQWIVVTEGELQVTLGGKTDILCKGQKMCIDPGIIHALSPIKKAQFFAIDFPGFSFPEDIYEDDQAILKPWIAQPISPRPCLDRRYFGERIDQGSYSVYELISGEKTGQRWSVALLDIEDSPKHQHYIETEHFIVVQGVLAIEIEGKSKLLSIGEGITVDPRQVHQLKSGSKDSVQVLCFNFPAFNPADFYPVK
jgi:quercetin dioxygenase-like cupin family protein